MIICSVCGRDIDAIGQDNISYGFSPICEDCNEITEKWLYADNEELIDFNYEEE